MNSIAGDTVITTAVVVALAVLVAWSLIQLERTHRRTYHLPRAPLGADVEGDSDLRRTVADLRSRDPRPPLRRSPRPPERRGWGTPSPTPVNRGTGCPTPRTLGSV